MFIVFVTASVMMVPDSLLHQLNGYLTHLLLPTLVHHELGYQLNAALLNPTSKLVNKRNCLQIGVILKDMLYMNFEHP